jgi:glycerol uptake facilitator
LSIIGAETIGTAILILFGDGVVAGVLLNKSKAQNAGWIVITFAWGLAVAMAVFAVGQFSGAHLNPAVTIGLWAIGSVDAGDVPKYLIGEFLGAFIGAVLVFLAYLPHWAETEDPGLKLAVFSTGPAIRNYPANVITEIIGTFILLFGILAIGANTTCTAPQGQTCIATASSGLVPLLVGLLIVVIGMSLGGPTGYAINPARDLGPRIAHAVLPIAGKGPSDWGYAWVPVVAPLIGGVLGAVAFDVFYPG